MTARPLDPLTPELRCLTTLVGRSIGLSAGELPPLSAAGWERVARLAAAHRVLPLVSAVLDTFDAPDIPRAVLCDIREAALRLRCRSLVLTDELGRVARIFHDGGIDMAAMKGPALRLQVYGPGTSRTMRDIDVLVRPTQLRDARTLLEANGFVYDEPVSRLSGTLQEAYARASVHITFQHRELGFLLELHQRPLTADGLVPIRIEDLLAGAECVAVGDTSVPVLNPVHHLFLVAAHGAKHGWWRLLWLADFAAFQIRFPEWFSTPAPPDGPDRRDGEPERAGVVSLSARARGLGLDRILTAAFRLSSLCFGAPPPGPAWDFLPESRSVDQIVEHSIVCLERASEPRDHREKAAELGNLLRLREDAPYRWNILRHYWSTTADDYVRFPLPDRFVCLYPILRPVFWSLRHLPRPEK
ncbi:MAG: nucleotidyltransferase family protein [Capsulimonadaceae bacterium]